MSRLGTPSPSSHVMGGEPVAWRWESAYGGEPLIGKWNVSTVKPTRFSDATDFVCEPLYAAQPAPAEHVLGWVTVRVDDTGDGLIINPDDAKAWNLKADQHYEGRFEPDGSYRIAIPHPAPSKAKCEICGGRHDNDVLTDICTSCEARINEEGSP